MLKIEALPSASGIRVVPRIPEELKVKAAKISAAKERKAVKEEKVKKLKNEAKDEFDEMVTKKSELDDGGKKMVAMMKPSKSKNVVKKGNPFAESDESEEMSGNF